MAELTDVTGPGIPWKPVGGHRGSRKSGAELIKGREGTPGNFRVVLVRDQGPGSTGPRHRHNFEQVRLPLEGRKSAGPGQWIGEGEIGWFPEGVYYGPEEAAGPSLALTWQFGGPSGHGYLSAAQEAAAAAELANTGTFKAGRYYAPGGGPEGQDSYEAIWEHVTGRRIAYPPGTRTGPLVTSYRDLSWVPDPAWPGTERKLLPGTPPGGPQAEFARLAPGAAWPAGDWPAAVTVIVLRGEVRIAGHTAGPLSGFAVSGPGSLTATATAGAELVAVRLPAVASPPEPGQTRRGGHDSP